MRRRLLFALLGAFCAGSAARAERISGIVRDPRGSPVASARVVGVSSAGSASQVTGTDGGFALDVPGGLPFTVRASRPGHAAVETLVEGTPSPAISIVLPDGMAEDVTVTASRTPRAIDRTPAAVTSLSRTDLADTPAPVLDDALRQIPGFSLFRRSGSRTANPTSQGVSLRGLGASGTSRALVVDDGIPQNDPFGGWVYWSRVPEPALERVEVVEGGASDLWGNAALGGVIQLVRRNDAGNAADVSAWAGSEETAAGALHLAGAAGRFRATGDAAALRTDGYVPVAPEERGPVDTRANSRHEAFFAGVSADLGESSSVFVRGSRYVEERDNGTPLQVNDTRISEANAGFDGLLAGGFAAARAYRSDQLYHQTFSAIAPDRASETLTSRQRVPSSATGGSLQWSRAAGSHELVAGADVRVVDGTSEDTAFLPSGSVLRPSGGEQRTVAGYVEDVATFSSRWTASAAVRFDAWSNVSGSTFVGGQRIVLADRSEQAWSPRVSTIFALSSLLSWTASAYRAFRAPTLNELYRPFRLGGVLTLANPALDPERLDGVETGARFQSRDGNLSARANFFWTELRDAVGNVTLSSSPSLITRQRENIGRVRDRGVELGFEARVRPGWVFSAGYLLADSRVVSSGNAPELVGKRTPQVPRDQITGLVTFARPSLATVAVQARWSGPQYDDDRNAFRLGNAFTLDAQVSRELFSGAEVFVAGENLTDRRNEIGRTPVLTLGPPATFRAGLRWRI
jgi:outer membrane receptor protein involved in Fe transport